MNKIAAILLLISGAIGLAACNKAQTPPATTPAPAAAPTTETVPPAAAPAAPAEETPAADAAAAPSEAISETDDAPPPAVAEINSAAQPLLRLGGPATTAPTSSKFFPGVRDGASSWPRASYIGRDYYCSMSPAQAWTRVLVASSGNTWRP